TAARTIRGFLRSWLGGQAGRTLLLTTHYMVEADELCDRIAIIDRGRVLACDTPAGLKRRVQQHHIFEITLSPQGQALLGPSPNGAGPIGRLPGVHSCTASAGGGAVSLKLALEEEAAIGLVVQALAQGGGHIRSLRHVEPTLEDVFIELVGRGLADDGGTT